MATVSWPSSVLSLDCPWVYLLSVVLTLMASHSWVDPWRLEETHFWFQEMGALDLDFEGIVQGQRLLPELIEEQFGS
ncbi:Hypothetical protein FKW44_022982 [Caligus rogercresseyi]|uniref:Uncharacterized protein n=1 Tax=Caligus rogercresseyi TaxID=217165 RepID=A0A7T8GNP5_CALRO|nr:Hypothetical protein FKW44_022982 [Caligus rogercresseyi]